MAKQRRINYNTVVALYTNNYGQVAIGKIFKSPHGHISKVLRGQQVPTRARGEKVTPVPFQKMSKETQKQIMSDSEIFKAYQELTGYKHVEEKPKKKKAATKKVSNKKATSKKVISREKMAGWDDMSTEEKFNIIEAKIAEGKSTRKVAEEIGIGQSTLIGTRNMHLYGSRKKPVNA